MYYYHVDYSYITDSTLTKGMTFVNLEHPIEYKSDVFEVMDFLSKNFDISKDSIVIHNWIPLKGEQRNK